MPAFPPRWASAMAGLRAAVQRLADSRTVKGPPADDPFGVSQLSP